MVALLVWGGGYPERSRYRTSERDFYQILETFNDHDSVCTSFASKRRVHTSARLAVKE
jgi:hypothetical protein